MKDGAGYFPDGSLGKTPWTESAQHPGTISNPAQADGAFMKVLVIGKAGAVGDRVKCHGLVLVQHAVLAAVIFAGDAEVAGEGHEVPGPLRHLRRPHAAIAGASVGLDDRAAVNVRRIGERLICDAECGETFGVDVLLFDVRQDVESPAGERHCV